MSEPLCLKCLFKKGANTTKINEKYRLQCPFCVYNIKQEKCIDGCGTTMCFCEAFGYWHVMYQPRSCIKFKREDDI
jgi:hypothetical protein